MLMVLVTILVSLGLMSPGLASDPLVGVNVVNPYKLSIGDQEAMFSQIKAAGVRAVRVSITPNDAGIDMATRITQQGIKIDWMIYRFGGYAPDGAPLSGADPEQFRKSFAPILTKLEARGIQFAAFELGNEINLSGYNPEFSRPGRGYQFSLQDLSQDPEGQQIARGFRQYLKILAVLKELRDHSRINQHTPILTAGFAVYEEDEGRLAKGGTADLVSGNATLQYLRANGLDSLVDGYAVHVYPSGNGPGNPAAAASRRSKLAKYVFAECRPAGGQGGKPCWLTEWGFNDPDMSCPIREVNRPPLVQETMESFRPYVQRGRLVGLFYFAWNSAPGASMSPLTLYRCGALTQSGRLAVDAGLLR